MFTKLLEKWEQKNLQHDTLEAVMVQNSTDQIAANINIYY